MRLAYRVEWHLFADVVRVFRLPNTEDGLKSKTDTRSACETLGVCIAEVNEAG